MLVDLEWYLRDRVQVLNETGGRGYPYGVRVFHCPWCGDQRRRGWMNVARWTAGCWNSGCLAEPRLEGGAVEWVRRWEALPSRARAWAYLRAHYPLSGSVARPPQHPVPRGSDWCRLPPSVPLAGTAAALRPFWQFLQQQWSVGPEDAAKWSLGACLRGLHAWRVLIPIVESGKVISFQTRTVKGADPKYRTAEFGPEGSKRAEAGRPASAMLFNLDAVQPDQEVVLVEGAGDVMAASRQRFLPPLVALLGQALSPEKAAMLLGRRPRRVVVAMDAEADAMRRGVRHVEDLEAWGLSATQGEWVGGKDPGAGGRLVVHRERSLRERVQARMVQ